MWNDRYSAHGLSLAGRLVFDPTGGILTAGLVMSGAAVSAAGTLAGGNYAKTAGQMAQGGEEFKAEEEEENAAQAFASGQRQAIDTETKTRLAVGAATTRAAASGVDAGVGSPVTDIGEISSRGSYQAALDTFNGASTASGLRNEAMATRYTGELEEYEGEEKQSASRIAALGTLAGGAGSSFAAYGAYNNPTASGRTGAGRGIG